MSSNPSIIEQLYRAFNARNIDAALSLMAKDVRWPKASEGGDVIGKDEIRAYWKRQWLDFDPHVEPLSTEQVGEKLTVRVHQIVRTVDGALLSESEVLHTYTIVKGLVERMQLGEGKAASAAFGKAPKQ